MNNYEKAIHLADLGFYVFPLGAGSKLPVLKSPYKSYATRNHTRIKNFWVDPLIKTIKSYNIGISTDRFGDKNNNEGLIVIDIDVDLKKGIDGLKTLRKLKVEGKILPETYTQQSPCGGYHFFYKTKETITQGAGVLGEGIDIRSKGSLIVGAGSEINGVFYTGNTKPLVDCPDWVPELRKEYKSKIEKPKLNIKISDLKSKLPKDFKWPTAVQGQRADVSYKLACRLKDYGFEKLECLNLMLIWDLNHCTPNLTTDELIHQVNSAYAYGKREIGVELPEKQFEQVVESESQSENDTKDPILKFNKEYAYVLEGGSGTILWQTKGINNKFFLDRIKVSSFHERFSNEQVQDANGKFHAITRLWMKHPERRTYDRVVFAPGKLTLARYYNLWKGYNEIPLVKGETPTAQMVDGLEAFKEHLFENVCASDEGQAKWLTGFFANLIQKPWDKPLVAPVLCGAKGVGKDSLIDRVGFLIEQHYVMAADARLFVGNFNAHLEHCLLVCLNEAFWSGDKKAEGNLKNLITGSKHVIERKGKEIYTAINYTRVIILGNEKWLVPATFDERRFAVFEIGTKRMQDGKFFHAMRKNMERGGYRYLLRYLLDFNTKGVDLNQAPNTKGLKNQKEEGLNPLKQWWLSCLDDGTILGGMGFETNGVWPIEVGCDSLREAFSKDCRDRGIRTRLPDSRRFGRDIKSICEKLHRYKKKVNGIASWRYKFPDIEICRKNWDNLIGFKTDWSALETEEDLLS